MPPPMSSRSAIRVEVADDRELVGGLGPAQHHHVGPRRVGGELAQHGDLGQHQLPGRVREQPRAGRRRWRACGAWHRTRRRRRRRPARPACPPAPPAPRPPCWSRRARTARSRAARRRRSPSPATVAAADPPATSPANATGWPSSSASRAATGRSDGPPAARAAYVAALGPAEVGAHDHPGAPAGQGGQRRQAGPDPAVVGDHLAVERHVEVGAQQDHPARHVEIVGPLHRHRARYAPSGRAGRRSAVIRAARRPAR